MIDMSTWDDLVVDVVDEIHLDPRNVRLDLPEGVPESDIIHDLFSNEKALSLVEGIAKVGLLTHEVPIVVQRGNQLVVVEGNRRVAALKAIQNPFLAPEHQARIRKLTQDLVELESLRRISVKLAPSQDDADQLVAALHTGNQRVAWSPNRQAAFFQAQIDAGKTAEQLLVQYPTIDVRKFIVRSRILGLFRDVEYADPKLQDFVSERRFPVSTLARLYDYDKFLELAQIDVDESNAMVTLRDSLGIFEVLAEKIIRDIKEKQINTRSLNSTKNQSYIQYMDELRDLVGEAADAVGSRDSSSRHDPSERESPTPPTGRTGGEGEVDKSQRSGGEDRNQPNGTGAGAKVTRRPRRYLDTENVVVSQAFPASIRKILTELSTIDIERFPNATLDLIRTFLEKSIKAYADAVNEDIRGSVRPHNGLVQLSTCLTWLEGYLGSSGNRRYVSIVKKLQSGALKDYIYSASHMNDINHNHLIFATTGDVKTCWETMERLMILILNP